MLCAKCSFQCIQYARFLFSRRFSSAKSPTITVASLFSRRFSSEKSPTIKWLVFGRSILTKLARLLQGQVFFFFFRQTTECMRSGHFF